MTTKAGRGSKPPLSWRVDRETVLVLGGRRALLLQLAHPLVAQGVDDHSNFTEDRVGRLLRTLDLSLTIVFGPNEAAERALDQIAAVHRAVNGTLPESVGIYPKGTPYSAEDPALQLWVHATLVDTALLFYDRFVTPLTDEERDLYYQETIEPATRFGIPEAMLPKSHREFTDYLWSMVNGESLAVGEAGRRTADAVLYPRTSLFPRRLLDPLNVLTIGTLPPLVRQMYGLRWNPLRAAALRGISATLPRMVRILPPRVRFVPHAIEAERRLNERAAG
jgi:uncharacterized protein (DUF2236 family)